MAVTNDSRKVRPSDGKAERIKQLGKAALGFLRERKVSVVVIVVLILFVWWLQRSIGLFLVSLVLLYGGERGIEHYLEHETDRPKIDPKLLRRCGFGLSIVIALLGAFNVKRDEEEAKRHKTEVLTNVREGRADQTAFFGNLLTNRSAPREQRQAVIDTLRKREFRRVGEKRDWNIVKQEWDNFRDYSLAQAQLDRESAEENAVRLKASHEASINARAQRIADEYYGIFDNTITAFRDMVRDVANENGDHLETDYGGRSDIPVLMESNSAHVAEIALETNVNWNFEVEVFKALFANSSLDREYPPAPSLKISSKTDRGSYVAIRFRNTSPWGKVQEETVLVDLCLSNERAPAFSVVQPRTNHAQAIVRPLEYFVISQRDKFPFKK